MGGQQMRLLRKLIPFDEALALCLSRVRPLSRTEEVPVEEAAGRVCAQDVVSRVSVPPFSRAAMDGYALRAEDTYGAGRLDPVKLRVSEVVFAGILPKTHVRKGVCVEIATGAPLPRGADAVVMVEDTEREGAHVLVYQAVHPGENVSPEGEDISRGTRLVARGEVINPSKVGAIAATGVRKATVYAKPLVAVVPTGNEIAEPGSRLRPGQIYDINSYTLSSIIAGNGGTARRCPIASDTVRSLERALEENLDCDIVVFSGGSSVGERDVLLDVLEKRGEVLFHGVAVKPGKPTIFGTVEDTLVFGMPGYPASCLSNAYLFLAPVIRRMAHLPEARDRTVKARMSKRVVSTTGRAQFLPVKLEGGSAQPVFKESGAITSMAFADGYVMIPSEVDLIEKGEEVTVHLF